jgi:hypothetical protein
MSDTYLTNGDKVVLIKACFIIMPGAKAALEAYIDDDCEEMMLTYSHQKELFYLHVTHATGMTTLARLPELVLVYSAACAMSDLVKACRDRQDSLKKRRHEVNVAEGEVADAEANIRKLKGQMR